MIVRQGSRAPPMTSCRLEMFSLHAAELLSKYTHVHDSLSRARPGNFQNEKAHHAFKQCMLAMLMPLMMLPTMPT